MRAGRGILSSDDVATIATIPVSSVNQFGDFLGPWTGAVQRTLLSRLGETILATDLGVAPGNDGAVNTARFNTAVAALPTRALLVFPPGDYDFIGTPTIARALTVSAHGAVLTFPEDDADQGFRATASHLHWYGGTIVGPQYATKTLSQIAVRMTGASGAIVGGFSTGAPTYINGIKLINVTLDTWAWGLQQEYVSDFEIIGLRGEHFAFAGITGESCSRGKVYAAIRDIPSVAGGGVYGINFGRKDNNSLVFEPPSSDITIEATVDGVTNWEGLDTHGGHGITFKNCIVRNCFMPLHVGTSRNAAGTDTFGPKGIVVANPNFTNDLLTGATHAGIVIAGASSDLATASIHGGVLTNYGDESETLANYAGAIGAQYTQGLTISGTAIHAPSPYGVNLYRDNYGFAVTGLTIVDAWSQTAGQAGGVYCKSSNNTGMVSGIQFTRTGARVANTRDYAWAVRVFDDASNSVRIGPCHETGLTLPLYVDSGGRGQFVNAFPAIPVANIGVPANGSMQFTTDGTPGADPAAGGGAGALAVRANGRWYCP